MYCSETLISVFTTPTKKKRREKFAVYSALKARTLPPGILLIGRSPRLIFNSESGKEESNTACAGKDLANLI